MAIEITSTTDSASAVLEATGDKKQETVEENSEAVQETETDEIIEDSEASEEEASSTDDEEEEIKDEENEEEDLEKAPEKKKKGGFKKKIDKLNARASKAEQEANYWREKALAVQTPEQKKEPIKEQAIEGKPKADDFDSHDDYTEALADWKYEQRDNKRKAEERETQAKTEYQNKVKKHQDRNKEFAKTHEDFDEVMSEIKDVNPSVAFEELIYESEFGTTILYELAHDREELERINKLSPFACAKEIGKREAILSKESSSKSKKTTTTTKAPPPVKPVGSKSEKTTRKSIYDKDLSQAEYERLWNEAHSKR